MYNTVYIGKYKKKTPRGLVHATPCGGPHHKLVSSFQYRNSRPTGTNTSTIGNLIAGSEHEIKGHWQYLYTDEVL